METRILATFILATLLVGCKLTKEERRLNRDSRIIERAVLRSPELKRVDTLRTIIPPSIIHGGTMIVVDSTKIDSLRQLLATCSDTVINEVIDYIPSLCNIAPVLIDDSAFTGAIWVEGGEVKYNIETKPIPVATPCPTIQPTKTVVRTEKLIPWWVWLIISGLSFALLGLIFKR